MADYHDLFIRDLHNEIADLRDEIERLRAELEQSHQDHLATFLELMEERCG